MNRNFTKYFLLVLVVIVLAGCASMGTPGGGPRDEDPPMFVRANPAPGAVNVNTKKIVIEFNELVNVKDAFTNVVVSPVSKRPPKVTSSGRRVIVEFQEDLLPNTTYTIDFGNSIEDNNESNKLYGFAYSFSTGATIDTLRMSGIVLGAEDLEPQQGIIVGVYANQNDTAFTRTMPDRIARTDDRGQFTVRGLAPGSYRIYALKDNDADYHYANPAESIAFLSELMVPSSSQTTVTDTIRDLTTGAVDTIVERVSTRFYPNDILLRTFIGKYKQQFIKENSRIDSTRIQLQFNAPLSQAPEVRLLNRDDLKFRYALEYSQNFDTLTYWLRGHDLISADTLQIAVSYRIEEPAKPATLKTDTLRLINRKPLAAKPAAQDKKKSKSSKDDTEEEPVAPHLALKFNGGSQQDLNRPLLFEFDTPIVELKNDAFHLLTKEEGDTVWQPLAAKIIPLPVDSGSLRQFKIEHKWDFDTQYRIEVDTLAATGIYGLTTHPAAYEFRTKKEDDYSAITLNISNFTDSVASFVELLNTGDKIVARSRVIDGKARFEYLTPQKYYARIYEDFNGNGIFDSGEFIIGEQPDMAYYYPKVINLKKNWDQEVSWDVFSTPVDMMKPSAIKKNKPDIDKRRKKTNERNDAEEDEEIFDPTANPFDPNRRKSTANSATNQLQNNMLRR